MGIKNLIKLIKEYAPAAIKEIKINALAGTKIGIDASIAIYQWSTINGIIGSHGKPINHIQGAFFRTVSLLCAGITPIYIFDGAPPKSKEQTIILRRQRNMTTSKYENISMHAMTADILQLLHIMKIPVIMAPSEAEAQAAIMSRGGIIYGVATEDTDVLALGAKNMIRGLSAADDISI